MKRLSIHNFKRMAELMLTFMLIAVMVPMPLNAAPDLEGHFAERYMRAFIAHGFVPTFADGTARPDHTISRAEFYTMINRAFGFTQLDVVGFVDVTPEAWYFQEISRAQAAGYILNGAEALPYKSVTREEAAAIISRITGLALFEAGAEQFSDVAPSAWSGGYIGAVVSAGLMNGYPDGTFRPYETITRAEAVIVLNRAMDRVRDVMNLPVLDFEGQITQPQIDTGFNQPSIHIIQQVQPVQPVLPAILEPVSPAFGNRAPRESDFGGFAQVISSSTFGGSIRDSRVIRGDVLVDTTSGTIRDLEVQGNLVFSERTSGTFTLTNVRVFGNIYVFGNPRITMDNSDARELIVNSSRTGTSVTLRRMSNISLARLFSAVSLSESNIHSRNDGFNNVVIESNFNRGARVTLAGNFNRVDVFERAVIRLDRGNIGRIVISSSADRSTVDIATSAIIDNADVSGAHTQFVGSGRIRAVDVRASGVTFNRRPDSTFGTLATNWWGHGDHNLRVQVVGRGNQVLRDAFVEISVVSLGTRHIVTSGWTDRNGNFDTWLPARWWDSNETYRISVRWGGQTITRNIRARDLGRTVRIDFPTGDYWWWYHPPSHNFFNLTVEGSVGTVAPGPQQAGSTVFIHTMGRPDHIFRGWQVLSGNVTLVNSQETHTHFVMPRGDVRIRANWELIPSGPPAEDMLDGGSLNVIIGAQQAAQIALDGIIPTNYITPTYVANRVNNAINATRVRGFASVVTDTGVRVTVTTFNLIPATSGVNGHLDVVVRLDLSGHDRTVQRINMVIPALP